MRLLGNFHASGLVHKRGIPRANGGHNGDASGKIGGRVRKARNVAALEDGHAALCNNTNGNKCYSCDGEFRGR